MAFVIFGDSFTFPEGNAATNRVHTYAKGFYENGIKVHVICFLNDYECPGEGISEGIHYYYPFGKMPRSRSFLVRRWHKLNKYFNTIRLIRNINRNDRILAINCWTQIFITQLFAYALARFNNTLMIQERSEHPLRYFQDSFTQKIIGKVKAKLEAKLSDGIFCISRYLINFYKDLGVSSARLFLVPSTVDPERFNQTGEKPFPFPYAGYFGGLTFSRDNVDMLIKSFALISEKYPWFHLVLGGFCSEIEKKQIENLVSELKLSSKVELLSYLSRQVVIKYIVNSDILVMVRSNDLKADASFPSKLTEYLATGKPVVTVNVGEISDFLVDGVNAYLVEPGNINALAGKLDKILSDYGAALEVAQKGNLLAYTTFNCNYQAKRMANFIISLSELYNYNTRPLIYSTEQ